MGSSNSRSHSSGARSDRGSALLIVLLGILAGTIIVGSVLSVMLTNYRLARVNMLRAQTMAVADSELEHMFYQLCTYIKVEQVDPTNVVNRFAAETDTKFKVDTGTAGIPNVNDNYTPFFADHANTTGIYWTVGRAISYDTGYTGRNGNTHQSGTVTYYYARVEVTPQNTGTVYTAPVRIGRHFSVTKTAGLQNALYYEGDLELSPGTNYDVAGDITVNNGNVYIGANGTASVTIDANLNYMQSTKLLNTDSNGNTVYRMPNTPGGALNPPTWVYGQSTQVQNLSQPIYFAGEDATQLVASRPDLFSNTNDVNRSLIVPPPGQTDEYSVPSSTSDDSSVNANRMYTKAGLTVTTASDGTPTYQTGIRITVQDNPSMPSQSTITIQTVANDGSTVDVTSQYSSVTSTSYTDMYDQREGRTVRLTTLDVGTLTNLVNTITPNFNGVVYINFYGGATMPRAVLIKDAEKTPVTYSAIQDSNSNYIPNGFTIATNGGAYIQGNYNVDSPTNIPDPNVSHTDITPSTSVVNNPALIMADAVTVVSSNFSPPSTSTTLASRVQQQQQSTYVPTIAAGDLQVHAGILTGNIPATTTTPSGGAQNLVRFLEDWSGHSVTLYGSVGRLFISKYFTAPYSTDTSAYRVYGPPSSRPVIYNPYLQYIHAGPYSLTPSRGTQFVWSR